MDDPVCINEGSYVVRRGTETPVGIVEKISDFDVVVRWGVQDKRKYEETISASELELLSHEIISADEIERRQAKEAAAIRVIKGE